MIAEVRADWNRYQADAVREGFPGGARWVLVQLGFQAMIPYRLGRWLSVQAPLHLRVLFAPAWIFYVLAAFWVRAAYGIRLELSADIGPGLYIGHFGGIYIRTCSIGPLCSIAQQTTIGPGADNAGPKIGKDVWIGAHSRVIGSFQVGDGSTIAAGARLVADVPSAALVAGDPARVVVRDFDHRKLI
ncbi:MAG: serine acetyltransferase [Pseudomonadota bacterium]